ncbi:hypothetical protein EDD11_001307, partial [Mortierella claussenii]
MADTHDAINVVDGQVEHDRCIAIRIGEFCCVGICINDQTFSDPVVKADPDNLIIDAKKGSSALVTIN